MMVIAVFNKEIDKSTYFLAEQSAGLILSCPEETTFHRLRLLHRPLKTFLTSSGW